MDLKSQNLSFLTDFASLGTGQQQVIDDLWQTLRQNAVEPGASSPFLPVFADDCLYCAVIMKKPVVVNVDVGSDQPNHRSQEQPSAPPSSRRRRRRGGRGQQGPATVTAPIIPTSHNTTVTTNADADAIPPASLIDPAWPTDYPIGLVYLHANTSNVSAREASIGVIICYESQKKGYAREAVGEVLRVAFEFFSCHRVQAAILDTPGMDRPMRLFIGLGFTHEGTRRHSVSQQEDQGIAGTWKDVTYLAMLDTDWVMRHAGKMRTERITLWSEMLDRHTRERDQVLKWEEKYRTLTKSASTETLREATTSTSARPRLADGLQEVFQTEPTETSVSSCQTSICGSAPPSPGPGICVTLADEDVVAHEMADAASNPGSGWATGLGGMRRTDASSFEMCRNWLQASSAHRLALPSIPSTRGSEAYPETPVTIPSPSSPGEALPPSSSESEDELSSLGGSPRPRVHLPFTNRSSTATAKNTRMSIRPRSSSRSSVTSYSSLSSFNSWSDANSGTGDWDVINGE